MSDDEEEHEAPPPLGLAPWWICDWWPNPAASPQQLFWVDLAALALSLGAALSQGVCRPLHPSLGALWPEPHHPMAPHADPRLWSKAQLRAVTGDLARRFPLERVWVYGDGRVLWLRRGKHHPDRPRQPYPDEPVLWRCPTPPPFGLEPEDDDPS